MRFDAVNLLFLKYRSLFACATKYFQQFIRDLKEI